MKVLFFSDIHFDINAAKEILAKKADIYVLAGDLSDLRSGLNEGAEILAPLKNKLWILPGNNETHSDVKKLCNKYGFFDFHGKIIKKEKYYFAGIGGSNKTHWNTPYELDEKEIEKILKKFRNKKNLILTCHCPPKNTSLDRIPNGMHVGSIAIKKFIEKEQPIYFLSGHIHENAGKIIRINNTTCFGLGKQGIIIEL